MSIVSTALTREQRDLREAVAALMAARSTESDVRRLMAEAAGSDATTWSQMAAMGLIGLIIPEEFGGTGAGAAELSVVSEQTGRALLCGPYLSTAVLTPYLLLALGDSGECAEILPRIAAGEMIATVAFAEAGSARPPAHPNTTAAEAGEWTVSGQKTYVLDAHAADLLYVSARTPCGTGIFAVRRDAPGLSVEPLSTVDQTRRQGRVTLSGTPARLIGDPGTGGRALEEALDRAAVALVAEQAGGAIRVTEMAADYARTRYQFGRAIGSFQAVKHLCVDMLLESQSALSAARHVAARSDSSPLDTAPFDNADPGRVADLALAQAFCSEAYVFAAATNIQVHGGIGFTWEHPAHLYLRRARTDAQIFGDAAWHRERYVALREESS